MAEIILCAHIHRNSHQSQTKVYAECKESTGEPCASTPEIISEIQAKYLHRSRDQIQIHRDTVT